MMIGTHFLTGLEEEACDFFGRDYFSLKARFILMGICRFRRALRGPLIFFWNYFTEWASGVPSLSYFRYDWVMSSMALQVYPTLLKFLPLTMRFSMELQVSNSSVSPSMRSNYWSPLKTAASGIFLNDSTAKTCCRTRENSDSCCSLRYCAVDHLAYVKPGILSKRKSSEKGCFLSTA
jgi:hypothetical protein